MNIIQIGASPSLINGQYIGEDDMAKMVKKIEPSEIDNLILVEPQKYFNPFISDIYKKYDFTLENVVIHYDSNIEMVPFYLCSKHKYISSLNEKHINKHRQQVSEVVDIKCLTLNQLFEKYNMVNVDVLFIDAEGIDDKIIYSINFDKYNINKLYYENLHVDNTKLRDFLENKGYKITEKTLYKGQTTLAEKIIWE